MKEFGLMPLNLQYFAETDDSGSADTGGNGSQGKQAEDDSGGQGGSDGSQDDGHKSGNEPKYTDEQVNEIINKKFAKWKDEQAAKDAEAKKLADMNNSQKKDYQLKQANEAKEKSDAELARYKMRDQARSMANDAGVTLTDEDLNHLVTADADTTKANMDWLSSLKGRIEKDVKSEYLKGNPPKVGGNKLDKKGGSYGATLAQQSTTRKNPYFKN